MNRCGERDVWIVLAGWWSGHMEIIRHNHENGVKLMGNCWRCYHQLKIYGNMEMRGSPSWAHLNFKNPAFYLTVYCKQESIGSLGVYALRFVCWLGRIDWVICWTEQFWCKDLFGGCGIGCILKINKLDLSLVCIVSCIFIKLEMETFACN